LVSNEVECEHAVGPENLVNLAQHFERQQVLGRCATCKRVVHNEIVATIGALDERPGIFDEDLASGRKAEVLLRKMHDSGIDLDRVDFDAIAIGDHRQCASAEADFEQILDGGLRVLDGLEHVNERESRGLVIQPLGADHGVVGPE